MNKAERIIAKCGGPKAVASLLEISVTSVYKWTYPAERSGSGGLIPSIHQQRLLERAQAAGIDLTPADFFDPPPPPEPLPPAVPGPQVKIEAQLGAGRQ